MNWETIKGYTIAIVGGLALAACFCLVAYGAMALFIDTFRAILH